MSGDVDGVMDVDSAVQALFDHADINMRRVEQCLAIGASIWQGRQIPVLRALGDGARKRQPVRMNAGALEHHDRVAVLDVRANQPPLRIDDTDCGPRQYDGVRLYDPAQRRRLAATPRTARGPTRIPPTFDEIVGSTLIC